MNYLKLLKERFESNGESRLVKDADEKIALLEKALEDREYLCSNRLTIADICVSYAIHLAGSLGIDQAFKPNIKRWTDMLFEREGYKKSLSYKYEE